MTGPVISNYQSTEGAQVRPQGRYSQNSAYDSAQQDRILTVRDAPNMTASDMSNLIRGTGDELTGHRSSGATASVAHISKDGILTVGNVGDSPVSVFVRDPATGVVTPLGEVHADHAAANPAETARIESEGGWVNQQTGRNGNSNMLGRALGDKELRGMSHEPAVSQYDLNAYLKQGQEVIVTVESDGVLENTSSAARASRIEAVMNHPQGGAGRIGQGLGLLADGNGSTDNISSNSVVLKPGEPIGQNIMLGVFDGHGKQGATVAEAAQQSIAAKVNQLGMRQGVQPQIDAPQPRPAGSQLPSPEANAARPAVREAALRAPGAAPAASAIAETPWLKVNTSNGESARYADIGKMSPAQRQQLETELKAAGVPYEARRSSLNGGTNVIAVDAQQAAKLDALRAAPAPLQNAVAARPAEPVFQRPVVATPGAPNLSTAAQLDWKVAPIQGGGSAARISIKDMSPDEANRLLTQLQRDGLHPEIHNSNSMGPVIRVMDNEAVMVSTARNKVLANQTSAFDVRSGERMSVAEATRPASPGPVLVERPVVAPAMPAAQPAPGAPNLANAAKYDWKVAPLDGGGSAARISIKDMSNAEAGALKSQLERDGLHPEFHDSSTMGPVIRVTDSEAVMVATARNNALANQVGAFDVRSGRRVDWADASRSPGSQSSAPAEPAQASSAAAPAGTRGPQASSNLLQMEASGAPQQVGRLETNGNLALKPKVEAAPLGGASVTPATVTEMPAAPEIRAQAAQARAPSAGRAPVIEMAAPAVAAVPALDNLRVMPTPSVSTPASTPTPAPKFDGGKVGAFDIQSGKPISIAEATRPAPSVPAPVAAAPPPQPVPQAVHPTEVAPASAIMEGLSKGEAATHGLGGAMGAVGAVQGTMGAYESYRQGDTVGVAVNGTTAAVGTATVATSAARALGSDALVGLEGGLGKVAVPLTIATGVYQVVTAKGKDDKVEAGVSTTVTTGAALATGEIVGGLTGGAAAGGAAAVAVVAAPVVVAAAAGIVVHEEIKHMKKEHERSVHAFNDMEASVRQDAKGNVMQHGLVDLSGKPNIADYGNLRQFSLDQSKKDGNHAAVADNKVDFSKPENMAKLENSLNKEVAAQKAIRDAKPSDSWLPSWAQSADQGQVHARMEVARLEAAQDQLKQFKAETAQFDKTHPQADASAGEPHHARNSAPERSAGSHARTTDGLVATGGKSLDKTQDLTPKFQSAVANEQAPSTTPTPTVAPKTPALAGAHL